MTEFSVYCGEKKVAFAIEVLFESGEAIEVEPLPMTEPISCVATYSGTLNGDLWRLSARFFQRQVDTVSSPQRARHALRQLKHGHWVRTI